MGGAAWAVVDSGVLPEPASAILVLLLVAAVPSAPGLAPRLTTNIALLVGWAPLLWWVDWPIRINHGAILVALASGGLATFVLSASSPRDRLASLVPQSQMSEVLLPLAAAAAWLGTAPLAFAKSPFQALSVLLPGADNWAHYAMFANLRAYGATTDVLGNAPDGSPWAFSQYPKGFHSLVATVSEVTFPRIGIGAPSLVAYAHTVALVVVLGLVMVTAAVLTVPRLSARPLVAVPMVALTWTGLMWEPGQKVLANGFASFWTAAVAGATALLLALAPRKTHVAMHVAAVGGLLVCVAHTWTPLGIIAAPATLLVLIQARGGSSGRRVIVWSVGILLLSALAAMKAIAILLAEVPIGFVVSEVSGFDGTSPRPTFVLLLVLIMLLGTVRAWAATPEFEHEALLLTRLRWLVLAPLLAAGSLGTLLVMQLNAIGTTSYYFLKYLLGLELMLACVTPAVLGAYLTRLVPQRLSRRRACVVGVVGTVAATQLFVPGFRVPPLLFSQTDDGTAAIAAPYTRPGFSRGVLGAVASTTPAQSFNVEYLPLGDGNAAQTFYPDAWYHAVQGSVTSKVWSRLAVLRTNADTPASAAALARELLDKDERLRIIVDRSRIVPLRDALGRPDLTHRLLPISNGRP